MVTRCKAQVTQWGTAMGESVGGLLVLLEVVQLGNSQFFFPIFWAVHVKKIWIEKIQDVGK